ncbi:MAG TPA: hypothetical protein H9669_00900 [Firmicutes bacterium]|nr:hypothetical protein [Bacillota bacterium]
MSHRNFVLVDVMPSIHMEEYDTFFFSFQIALVKACANRGLLTSEETALCMDALEEKRLRKPKGSL